MSTPPVIETEKLTKSYGRARGIIDLDLRVERGEIFGFLGPNGAGKTTTIRTLLDFIRPTGGSARVFGLDARRDSVEIRKRIGNLPGEPAYYTNLTGRQVVEYSGHLRGSVPEAEIARLTERLGLDLSRPIKAYSHGNRQKVGLVQAMMHKPELLILDEPTNGLDPLVQQELYSLLEEVRDEGRTVFFSSHILPEVERLCDRVGIIKDGRLVAVETVAGLKRKAVRRVEITFEGALPVEQLRAIPEVVEINPDGSALHLVVQGSFDNLVKAAAQHTVVNLVTHEPSLEEVFLTYYREGRGDAA